MTEGQRSVKQKIIAEPGAQVQNVVQAVIEQVTLGVRALPTDYATRIANFLCDYLGTPERPVPFGGREEALQALDRWLDDPDAPPYLLLATPAGRGKSALLVRWLERLRQRAPDLPVVFVPISLRYNTASQAVFFAALAARLAHLFGEKVPADLNQAPAIWRGMVSEYLMSQHLPNGRLLVVLDGLDEATDWQAGPDLFPSQPPPGLRIVVSARYLAGESGLEGWLRRLGWDRHRLAPPGLETADPRGRGRSPAEYGLPPGRTGPSGGHRGRVAPPERGRPAAGAPVRGRPLGKGRGRRPPAAGGPAQPAARPGGLL